MQILNTLVKKLLGISFLSINDVSCFSKANGRSGGEKFAALDPPNTLLLHMCNENVWVVVYHNNRVKQRSTELYYFYYLCITAELRKKK